MKNILCILSLLWVCGPVLGQALSWLTPPQRDIGLVPNDSVRSSKLSANGRYLTFTSRASNFVNNDTNKIEDVFIKDLQTGDIERVNTLDNEVQAINGVIRAYTSASDNGRFVSFSSNASNFPENNGDYLVYTKDLQTGEIITESLYGNNELWSEYDSFNEVGNLHLSFDGRYLVFKSAADLDNSSIFIATVFRKDRLNQTYELVSISDAGMKAAAQLSGMSKNGRYIIFNSGDDILTGVTGEHLYLRDMSFSTTVTVDVNSQGQPSAVGFNNENAMFGVSDNGDVAYCTSISDLVDDDNNGLSDVFLYSNGLNQRVSLTSSGLEVSDGSCKDGNSRISADGTVVFFAHSSSQISDQDINNQFDFFQYNVTSGNTKLLTPHEEVMGFVSVYNTFPSLSADGSLVTFSAIINGLIETELSLEHSVNYLYDQSTDTLSLGTAAAFKSPTLINQVLSPKISDDQQWVVYATDALNANPQDVSHVYSQTDLYLLNRNNDEVTSIGTDILNGDIDMSPNGRFVVFVSRRFQPISTIELIEFNVFIYDRLSGEYVQISKGYNPKVNNEGDVVFNSAANDLVPGDNNGVNDVFIYDYSSQLLGRVSVGMNGQEANGSSMNPDIGGAGLGTWVVFESTADNLVIGDVAGMNDVFLINWPGGNAIRVSEDVTSIGGDDDSNYPIISEDSTTIAFASDAQNLTSDDYTDANTQMLVYDRTNAALELISVDTLGDPIELGIWNKYTSISSDGRYISFVSNDNDVVPQDSNDGYDLFIFDRLAQNVQRISQFIGGGDISQATLSGQVVVDNSTTPPLFGVVMSSSPELLLDDPTAIYDQGFLFQSGGPGVGLNMQLIGEGQVTGNLGYQCNDQCSDIFVLGAVVDLIALPGVGFVFHGWTGDACLNQGQQCEITMNEEKFVQAIFIDENDVIFTDGFED